MANDSGFKISYDNLKKKKKKNPHRNSEVITLLMKN